MRVIASVQSKRGSSRGLVHYLAHSKLDLQKEPEKGRELFNAFTEHLSVKSANNFLKADCGKNRPSNDELHHLVLSFKDKDSLLLGSTDDERKKKLKAVTRFAIGRLERHLHSDKLAWAAAVHLNTANPHVHIAIQKQYLTKDLKGKTLNKIPREALPHFEIIDGEKRIVEGILIESARGKLEEFIEQRSTRREHDYDRNDLENVPSKSRPEDEIMGTAAKSDDREILRQGLLVEYQLKFKEERIAFLIERRESLKFQIKDSRTGLKQKVSLKELGTTQNGSDDSPNVSQFRQLQAITHSILAKEESEYFALKGATVDIRKEASEIRKAYKKNGFKLPAPALTKRELDELQTQCLASSKIREYSYLEQVRIDRELKKEIEPRDRDDLEILKGQKILSEVWLRLHEKQLSDFKTNSYYRRFPTGNGEVSLAMLDREFNPKYLPRESAVQTIRRAIKSLTVREKSQSSGSDKNQKYQAVNAALIEQSTGLQSDLRKSQNVVAVLGEVLTRNQKENDVIPRFSASELIQIEGLSRRLKLPNEYADNWRLQRDALVGHGQHQQTFESISEAKDISDVDRIISGRLIAREVLCEIEFNKAKEDHEEYRRSKRFHKFAIDDKDSGTTSYLSLNDVDLPRNRSFLDQTLNLMLESRPHRQLRREIEGHVKQHEQSLKAGLAAAKELCLEARKESTSITANYLSTTVSKPEHQPIFTAGEVNEINKRIATKPDSKEAKNLELLLEKSSADGSTRLNEILTQAIDPGNRDQGTRNHTPSQAEHVERTTGPDRRTGKEIIVGFER